jgi:hypothetical protein
MPHSGQDLGVDLYGLWRAGTDNLPAVAAVYAGAARSVADTAEGETSAFRRPEQFGGGPFGPACSSWTALRDELATMLRDTATHLELAGEALCLAASEYAKADLGAAGELGRLKHDNATQQSPR